MEKSVRRDMHKMRAFVRFREVPTPDGPWFVAWFEPHHLIVEANAPFFVERFTTMNWSILTPDLCAHWDQRRIRFTPGVTRDQAPDQDRTEDLWRTYYASIFNPARVKVDAMKKEMPAYYWKNLPEAGLIPELLAEAPKVTAQMIAASRAQPVRADFAGPAVVPDTDDLDLVREAAKTCRACPLWQHATCTVFGEGPRRPRIVVVGEQPGDQEDLAGRPFVGPAGLLFDRALAAAGVDRTQLYVTNAVKHFKWKPQGKRRLHQKPGAREVAACRPWLAAELKLLQPELIVSLGGTAASSLTGAEVRVLSERGRQLPTEFGAPTLVTVHPSSLLRQPDPARKEADFAAFVSDLRALRDYAPRPG
jgi:DNA polymerase